MARRRRYETARPDLNEECRAGRASHWRELSRAVGQPRELGRVDSVPCKADRFSIQEGSEGDATGGKVCWGNPAAATSKQASKRSTVRCGVMVMVVVG